LVGDDEFEIEQAVARIRAESGVRDIDYTHVYASDLKRNEVIDHLSLALTLTFDGSPTLLWLDTLTLDDSIKGALYLLEAIAKADAVSIVVISSPSVDARLGVVKALKAIANTQDFKALAPWQTDLMVERALQLAYEQGLSLTTDCAQALVEQIGTNTRLLHRAIEQLRFWEQPIQPEQVRRFIPSQTTQAERFSQGLLHRDVGRAMQELERHLVQGEPALKLLARTAGQLRVWIGVKAAVSEYPYADSSQIARAIQLPGNPNRVYYLKQEVQHTTLPLLLGLLKLLLATEKAIKSGADEATAMRQLVLAVGKAK
jgi:DNA polymerase-3 subunit delta